MGLNLAEIYLDVSIYSSTDHVGKSEHTLKHRINHLESLVDLLADLGSGEDDLATHEDQEDDFRLSFG